MLGVLPEIREPVDLKRYSGLWYELARTKTIPFEPPGITDVQAFYEWDGTTFSIKNSALMSSGKPMEWTTTVTKITNSFNTRLLVETGPHKTRGVYRIIMLDPEYQWAVVAGGDDNKWIWVLGRTQRLKASLWPAIHAQLADNFGVDLRTLEYTPHTRDPEDSPVKEIPEPAKMVPLANGDFIVSVQP